MSTLRKILKSKIVWFNVVTTLIEIAAVLEGVMPDKYFVYTSASKSILTIILRAWFNKPAA